MERLLILSICGVSSVLMYLLILGASRCNDRMEEDLAQTEYLRRYQAAHQKKR